jgi:imidazolonepropionase-like amidohydrolase
MKTSTLINNINIIPMPGTKILKNYSLLIENSKIKSVAKEITYDKEIAKVIDGTGKYLIPGLFDMHVHLEPEFMPLFLMNGVTSIRELGNTKDSIFDLKKQIASGEVIGPRLFVCGPVLEGDPPVWEGFRIIKSEEEGRRAVVELKGKGADFIKVYHTLTPKIYKAILDECSKQNIDAVGHIPDAITVIDALKSGHKSIEHMYDIRTYTTTIKTKPAVAKGLEDWSIFTKTQTNQEKLDELNKLLEKNNAYICPTIVQQQKASELSDYPKLRDSEEAKYLDKKYRDIEWNPSHPDSDAIINGYPPLFFENIGVLNEGDKKLIPTLAKHGTILAGSDTPNAFVIPGFSLLQELELLVESGLKPYEALEAATYNGAKFLNVLHELGTIQDGKVANMVLLSSNPLDNISAIRAIEGIFLNGKYISEEDLKLSL